MTWPLIGERILRCVSAVSARENLVDLLIVDAPAFEPVRAEFEQLRIAAALGVEQVLDGDDQVGAVEQRQLVAGANHLPGLVDDKLFDPPIHPRGHRALAPFVELDVADGRDLLRQRLVVDRPCLHAGQHDAIRRELHAADDSRRQRLDRGRRLSCAWTAA